MASITFLQRFGTGLKTVTMAIANGIGTIANGLVQTGTDGFIPDALIHPALVPAPISLPAAVAIAAGKQVNIFNNNGVPSIQLADATTSPPLRSDGYVSAAVAQGANGNVYRRGGVNTAQTGLTPDNDYFLGAAGAVTITQNTTPGQLDQYIGLATSATTLDQLPSQLPVQN